MVTVITESTIIEDDYYNGVFISGRTVTLSPYAIGKYEVTQKLYQEVMGINPSYFNSDPADGENQELRPVEQVNWYHAIAFCNKLSLKDGYELCYSVKNSEGKKIDWKNIETSDIPKNTDDPLWNAAVCDMSKNGYRLPTSAEWEFAARGGTQNEAEWYSNCISSPKYEGLSDENAWISPNSSNITHEVGEKKANSLNLYDMAGNVFEWCNDWYGKINSDEIVTDPTGPESGNYKVLRGGSYYEEQDLWCAFDIFYGITPYYPSRIAGFRLARSIR